MGTRNPLIRPGLDEEIRAAALDCARKGFRPGAGDPLPDLISGTAADWIEGNLEQFQTMVTDAKHALEVNQ